MATEVVSDSAKLVSHKRVIAEREQTIETLRADNERLRRERNEADARCSRWAEIAGEHGAEIDRLRTEIARKDAALREIYSLSVVRLHPTDVLLLHIERIVDRALAPAQEKAND